MYLIETDFSCPKEIFVHGTLNFYDFRPFLVVATFSKFWLVNPWIVPVSALFLLFRLPQSIGAWRGSPLTESHQLPFYGPFARSVKCWRGNLSLVTRNDWCSVFKGRVALWGSVYDFLGLLCGVRDTYLCTYLRVGQANFPSGNFHPLDSFIRMIDVDLTISRIKLFRQIY